MCNSKAYTFSFGKVKNYNFFQFFSIKPFYLHTKDKFYKNNLKNESLITLQITYSLEYENDLRKCFTIITKYW